MILEQYIEGDEISVNAHLKDGQIIFFLVSDRISFDEYPGGIIKEHRLPSKYSSTAVQERIYDLVKDVCQRFGITDGPVYFQIMVREGAPYLIEFSPRLDGCHLWRLIKAYCGVNLLDMTVQDLVSGARPERRMQIEDGGTAREAESCCTGKQMITEFFCQKPGTRFEIEEFSSRPALYRKFYYQNGDVVRPVNGHMEKCGYRIYSPEIKNDEG